jgi:tRNA pseudouridine38-40 synthase
MRNIALRIEYDGTDFSGSQWQTNGRTVQGALEEAWSELTQERRRVTMAGRTDAGVHAHGQIANVQTETGRDLATVLRGLNAILPEDVGVLDVWEVPFDFHARHTAIRREYRYLIDNGKVAAPLLRRHTIPIAKQLDVEQMDAALQYVVGRHDFIAYSDGPQEGSTIRVCYAANCRRIDLWGQPLVAVDIAANGFLRHMVRKIVGMLLLVGEGRLALGSLAETLNGAGRRPPLAPAHGLYLMNVVYPGDQPPVS